jgi:hypothetical protein
MIELILTVLAAFVLLDYTLGRAGASENWRLFSSLAFAVIVFIVEANVL